MAQVNTNALPIAHGPPWTNAALRRKHKAALVRMVDAYHVPGVTGASRKPAIVGALLTWGSNPVNWAAVSDEDRSDHEDDVGVPAGPAPPGPAIDPVARAPAPIPGGLQPYLSDNSDDELAGVRVDLGVGPAWGQPNDERGWLGDEKDHGAPDGGSNHSLGPQADAQAGVDPSSSDDDDDDDDKEEEKKMDDVLDIGLGRDDLSIFMNGLVCDGAAKMGIEAALRRCEVQQVSWLDDCVVEDWQREFGMSFYHAKIMVKTLQARGNNNNNNNKNNNNNMG
eukprot:178222_1